MKLGIVVVYLVDEADEDLLDLHLALIREHTEVPYMIYGSVNRLLPRFVPKLEADPKVKICPCPDTPLRGYEEHAYYLELLIAQAIEEGVSHVALLNVDSFPIRRGWAREMAGRLSLDRVLCAVMRTENDDRKPHPSGMLFPRDFYLERRPTILLSEEELRSEEFAQYRRETDVVVDTGIGYGFKLYAEKLGWEPLERSNLAEDHYIIGSMYGDLVFHLGGAARGAKFHIRERRRIDEHRDRNVFSRSTARFIKFGSRFVPLGMRKRLRPLIASRAARSAQAESQEAYDRARAELLRDPEAFFSYLRTGVRTEIS